MLITTGQAAAELTRLLTNRDGHPTITSVKVLTLVRAGLFTDHGRGKHVMVDFDDVSALAARTRYVADPSEIDDLIFRVSLIEQHDDLCYDLAGGHLRATAGVDYSNPTNIEGIEGVWEASDHTANRLVREQGILLGTCKGYVAPDHVRTITEWLRVSGTARRYFRTERAPKVVRKAVGTGIWIDVPPGRESGILVG